MPSIADAEGENEDQQVSQSSFSFNTSSRRNARLLAAYFMNSASQRVLQQNR